MFFYSEIQFCKLLESVENNKSWQFKDPSYYVDRDKVMLMMSYYLGLRKNEVANASVDCIDFENDLYFVHQSIAKNKKARIIPIPNVFCSILKCYVDEYNLDSWLFLSRDQKGKQRESLGHLTSYAVGFRFRIYRKLAGFNSLKDYSKDGKKLSLMRFHDLRGTYATNLDKAGIRLKVIQNLLGHSHLFSTERYLCDSNLEERKQAVNSVFD